MTFTVDLNGEVPHLVAVMGGTFPTVTYDSTANSGDGELTVETTTFDTTNQANETFSSMVGFAIMTDSSLGSTPLGIIAQTDAWVGDMFPLFPGMDSNAANSGIGGTLGSFTAKCGTTFYGPTGGTRTVNLFIPNSSISTMFGSTDADGNTIDENSITGYNGSTRQRPAA